MLFFCASLFLFSLALKVHIPSSVNAMFDKSLPALRNFQLRSLELLGKPTLSKELTIFIFIMIIIKSREIAVKRGSKLMNWPWDTDSKKGKKDIIYAIPSFLS